MGTENKFDYLRKLIDAGNFTDEQCDLLGDFFETVTDSYILVEWPDSQNYMEEEWFDEEAILSESSSYLIPFKRVFNS